jgi:hypothetical protein
MRHVHACIASGGDFLANVVNYDSLNNKNSTDIELGNCIANALCQFLAKYYLLKVFILESNLSIELKTTHVLTYFYTNCFILCEELSHEVCPNVLDTPCVTLTQTSELLILSARYK